MVRHVCPPPPPPSKPDHDDNTSKSDDADSTSCQSCGKSFGSVRRAIIHEVEECKHLARQLHPAFRLKVFNCEKCDQYFVVRKKFNLHMERHHSSNNIENIDPENNVKIDNENVHVVVSNKVVEQPLPVAKPEKEVTEEEVKRVGCGHCGKTFSSRKSYHEHEVTVHNDLSNVDCHFKCEYCPKLFLNKSMLEMHATSHTSVRKFQCHLCPEQFKTGGNLTAHMASCHDAEETGLEKKFQCKFCPKTFRFQAHVSQHERSHTKEKPFVCHLCNKAFTVKCNLKAHMETHKSLEERSFKCDKCDHRATSLPLLKLHQYNHTGERPFVCDLCGESYKRPHNLRRHKKTMCRLRPGGVKLNKTEEAVTEEAEVYERIETVVVQGEDGVIIETAHAQYEETGGAMFVEDGIRILPDVFVHEEAVMAEDIVEEGIVEEDGIKYETPLLIM